MEISFSIYITVWVSYPLKQGLKQTTIVSQPNYKISLSQLSIKTRIETTIHPSKKCKYEISLSQLSIKTRIETFFSSFLILMTSPVWVSYPLKQGLKQPIDHSEIIDLGGGLSQLSIKTRIETRNPVRQSRKRAVGLSQLSIKTRIETQKTQRCVGIPPGFESAIH